MDNEEKIYHYECWYCGKDVFRNSKTNVKRTFCEDCKEKFEKEREKTKNKYLILKQKLMLTRALDTLEKINKFNNFKEYLEPYKAIENYCLENPTKVDSQYEVIAILELLKNRINIKIQPKILNYYCDIMLKDQKIILEIDGYFHKGKEEVDGERDREIREKLGVEWEIIRIPVKYLKENPQQLVKAIHTLKKRQQKLRKTNYGNLPSWYTDRSCFKKIAGDL